MLKCAIYRSRECLETTQDVMVGARARLVGFVDVRAGNQCSDMNTYRKFGARSFHLSKFEASKLQRVLYLRALH